MRGALGFVICLVRLFRSTCARVEADADEDVLLRGTAQWEVMEKIYREAVHTRTIEATHLGTFDETATLGLRPQINWIDLWGPTYTCPTLEHVGVVGDGGKWLCAVDKLLQREGCVIYSLGSFLDFTFEAAVLQRTACTVHVFDPTVLPSEMRRREEILNGDGPVRIRWHSIGISDTDTDTSSDLKKCYGGLHLKGRRRSLLNTATSDRTSTAGRRLQSSFSRTGQLWQPADADKYDQATGSGGYQPFEELKEASGRDGAVRDVLWKLSAERDRIVAAVDTCGPEAHRPRGIAPLPDAVDAGEEIAGISETPHGDAATLCRMATLPSVMKTLGHDWVDVLKMDIEGSEFQGLGHLAALPGDAMRFTQLQLELHWGRGAAAAAPNVEQLRLLHSLQHRGYRMAMLEPNIYFNAQTCHEMVMLKMDACGNVVAPDPGPPAADASAQGSTVA